jgi:hypothetical protein
VAQSQHGITLAILRTIMAGIVQLYDRFDRSRIGIKNDKISDFLAEFVPCSPEFFRAETPLWLQ